MKMICILCHKKVVDDTEDTTTICSDCKLIHKGVRKCYLNGFG